MPVCIDAVRSAETLTEGSGTMAYLMTHFWPGGTEEQYRSMLAAVHPAEGLPEGQTVHVAGPTEGGYLISVLWDSKEDSERFMNGTLLPALPVDGRIRGCTGAARGRSSAPRNGLATLVVTAWTDRWRQARRSTGDDAGRVDRTSKPHSFAVGKTREYGDAHCVSRGRRRRALAEFIEARRSLWATRNHDADISGSGGFKPGRADRGDPRHGCVSGLHGD